MAVLVTGGAGFIGSHLVDKLVSEGKEILVLDNLSKGKREFVNKKAEFIKFDLCSDPKHLEEILEDVDRVWHLAADPDVKESGILPEKVYANNVLATFNLLEAMRKSSCKEIIFTSTSAVYGQAKILPTPEDYFGQPTSVYGATKLACESLISSYCHSFEMKAWIYRLANIIGPRSNHGIIPDFIAKLNKDSSELEIFGDGKQNKSYLYIEDCLEGMIAGLKAKEKVNISNIGNTDSIFVSEIAKIVCEERGIKPKLKYTGGKTGWIGDVPVMLLSIDRINKLGWSPKYSSREAVVKTIRDILS